MPYAISFAQHSCHGIASELCSQNKNPLLIIQFFCKNYNTQFIQIICRFFNIYVKLRNIYVKIYIPSIYYSDSFTSETSDTADTADTASIAMTPGEFQ